MNWIRYGYPRRWIVWVAFRLRQGWLRDRLVIFLYPVDRTVKFQ